MDKERFALDTALFLLQAQQEQPQAVLLHPDVSKQGTDDREDPFILALFVGEALQPKDSTRPLLARFAHIGDRLAKVLGDHRGSNLPQTMIGVGIVGVGAHLKGESKESGTDCLESMGMESARGKFRPGLCDLIERNPLRTDEKGSEFAPAGRDDWE